MQTNNLQSKYLTIEGYLRFLYVVHSLRSSPTNDKYLIKMVMIIQNLHSNKKLVLQHFHNKSRNI